MSGERHLSLRIGAAQVRAVIFRMPLAIEVGEIAFRTDQQNCLELSLQEWEARDLHRRFTESLLNPLRPLL